MLSLQRPGRAHSPAPLPRAAWALLVLLPALQACAGSRGPQAPGPPPVPPTAAALLEVYDAVRVPGLEDRRFQPEHYWEVLDGVIGGSDLFRVEVVGRSAEGRPLRHVSVGEGPVPVLLWSQMHGNESTASMALADVFAFFRRYPDHPVARVIRERLTVHVVPVLNPDGAHRFQRRNAQGIDINRDARALSTPEARALKRVRDRIQPRFAFNLHDQNVGTRVGDTDRGVAIALLAPPFDETREVDRRRREAMEVMGVMLRALEPLVGGHVARYDDTFNPRAFGDLMTRWGASTILVESGGWANDPQKQYLRKVNFVALLTALESIATESYRGVGIEAYTSLPPNGRRLPDLLVRGGTVVIPGLPPYRADLLVNYDAPLLERGGRIADIGDLADVEARDTLDLSGLYILPADSILDRAGGVQLQPGVPAAFAVSRTADGSEVLWRFRGGPQEARRR